jgi:transcriptional regulator with XRE-family HTH domain
MNTKKQSRKRNFSTMRMVGAQMQTARKAAGYTQRSLGEAVLADEETIASIEQGRRPLLPDLAETLDQLLDTKGLLLAGVQNMPEFDQFPLYAEQYMVHEREAVALSWYDNAVLPGLLQTEAYARAVLRERVPATTRTNSRPRRRPASSARRSCTASVRRR